MASPSQEQPVFLLDMANELLLLFASHLPLRDIGSFLLVNRRLAFVLTPLLHELALRLVDWMDPLHWASVRGHISLIDIILQSGVDINLPDAAGFTALQYAAGEESVETVAFLLKKGANLHLRDRSGDTPFTRAMKCLPFENQTSMHMPSGYPPAYGRRLTRGWNSIAERERIAVMLMEHGADITHKTTYLWVYGWTALHSAVRARSVTMVRLLLERGSDVNAKTEDRQTPLLSVPFEDYSNHEKTEEIVRILLGNGANVAAQTPRWDTALHHAVLSGNMRIVKSLLEYGANPNAQNVDGCSTLHKVLNSMCNRANDPSGRLTLYAATNKTLVSSMGYLSEPAIAAKVEMIKLLLEKGANINIRDSSGRLALDIARLQSLPGNVLDLFTDRQAFLNA